MSKPILACDCDQAGQTVQNFGGIGDRQCKGLGRPINAIAANLIDSNGDDNGVILGTTVLGDTFFNGKYLQENAIDRWLFLEGLTDYDSPVVDPNVEDINDGRTYKLNKNSKQVTFSIITTEYAVLAAKIEALDCRPFGFMFDDSNKSLVGHKKSETSFTFRKVQAGSLIVDTIEPTTGTVGRVQVRFKWDREALDTQVDYIPQSRMNGYIHRQDAPKLIDGNIVDMVATVNTLAFRIESDYGGADQGTGLGGLTEVHLDVTAGGVVEPVTGIVPTAILGNYIATFVTPLSGGEVLEARGIGGLYVQKTYDLKNLIGKTVTA